MLCKGWHHRRCYGSPLWSPHLCHLIGLDLAPENEMTPALSPKDSALSLKITVQPGGARQSAFTGAALTLMGMGVRIPQQQGLPTGRAPGSTSHWSWTLGVPWWH